MANETNRPNPELLLAQIKAEEAEAEGGKLKIFIGAAPGVGKTYSMLQDALIQKAQGVDVVIGLAETHGRSETGKLLSGLEILPKKNIDYKGQVLQEFDLDAAIARNPQLILVDELAHTNAPTCRHAKRWQDVQELLNRGIDVYTTLNVQHLESLNDVIHQIIGIKVRETIPDSMLEEAELELVDLPPDELLKRLAEGKVYFKEQAKVAIKNFFKKSNLTALRELALRITAEQVNMDVMSERKFQDTQETWPTAEKLLVCVGPGKGSAKLIRAAKRLANTLHAEWMAVYVDAPKLNITQNQKDNIRENLRLAEQLGAETSIVGGDDLVKEIIRVARERNVTKIAISKQVRPFWRNLLRGSLVDQLVRDSGEIDIYVIRADDEFAKENKISLSTRIKSMTLPPYIAAAIVVAICTTIAYFMSGRFALSNLIMVYLLGLIIVAGFGRHGPSLFASITSVLALDFFFVTPAYSFNIKRSQYIFTFLVMLVIGNVMSYLTIKIRQQAERSRLREKRTYAILALTKELACHRGLKELIKIATQQIAEVFDSEVLTMIGENEKLSIVEAYPKMIDLDEKEMSVANWVYDMEEVAGLGTATLPYSDAIYFPLTGTKKNLGVLRIKPLYQDKFFQVEQMDLLKAFINQTALAIEADMLQTQN